MIGEGQRASAARRFRWAALAALGTTSLYVAWLATGFGGEWATQAVSDLGLLIVSLAAAAACGVAARRERGRARRGWALLGVSALAWATGEAAWSFYELALQREVPFPSLADIGYLGAVPLAAAAMLAFPTAPRRMASRLRTLLDGLIIGGSLLFVSWATLLGPLYRAGSGSVLEQAIGLAYPAGDVVIVALVIFVAARARRGSRVPLALLGTSLVALAVADSGFAYLTLNDTYASGNLIDAGWLVGYLLIGLAALRPAPDQAARADQERPLTRLGALVPYVAVLLAVVMGATRHVRDGALEPFLFWNTLALVVLVVSRQLLTLLENLSLARNLEEKVQARTAELERAVRQLAEAKRLQDAFVANASHELRTPVTTMVGAASTLLRPEIGLGEDARELAEMARRGAIQMSRLVEDLLLASGLAEGIRCARSSFDVAGELGAALEGFAPSGKRVEAQIPGELAAVGDAERVRVIIEHLLSNADKFAPEGTTIHLEAARRGDAIEVVVRDEGPGIPEALQEKVFERFFQVDSSRTREHGGAGLGLFIARQLAEAMGGRLTLADSGRAGAAFRLTLPAAPAQTSSARAG